MGLPFDRRSMLCGIGASVLAPRLASAKEKRLTLSGSMKQGGLVVGRAAGASQVNLDGKKLRLAEGGLFVFGISYDQTKSSEIVAHFTDGETETQSLKPEIRHYDIQRINGLPQDQVTPPPDILARIQRESALDAERMQIDSDGVGFGQGFEWPLPGIISSIYGSQRILNGTPMSPHLGVDVAAPQGTPIRAPADAVVTLVDDQYLNGGFTILDHGHGVSTNYVHQINIRVKEGDRVTKGQIMSEVGTTGRATGPNLHWGMNWFTVKLDASLATATALPPKA